MSGLNPSGLGNTESFSKTEHESTTIDSLNNADLANAGADTVPTAQGDGTLAMQAGGGGLWTEDGNSSQTDTGASSHTYTLADAFDIVLVQFQLQNTSGTNNSLDLRANGDTGTNYAHINSGGATGTGNSEVPQINLLGSGHERTSYFVVDGRWSGVWTGGSPPPDGGSSRAVGWNNGAITSPLTQVTIVGTGTFDVSWSVLGRDIGPAGAP